MSDTYRFALIMSLTSAVVLVAVLANRLTERFKLPAPLLMLVAAAIAAQLVPGLPIPSDGTVQRVVTVALVLILFDGGMHIGWARFRPAAGSIALVGVLGTFLTAAGGAAVLHAAFGVPWYLALLVATAVSPTDPAVVFSVLGQREIAGRSGTILEGESGANDPVGIALMGGLIAAGTLSWAAVGYVSVEFLLQMVLGASVGIAGGLGLLAFMRKVTLPSEGLYPLRTLACALLLYGLATLAHGSGFLAVFVAGILIGHRRAPYQREIERFHSALAGLAEIVAFVVLGLTIDLDVLARTDVWLPGLVLWVLLAVVVRPLFVRLCLIPARLQRNERTVRPLRRIEGRGPDPARRAAAGCSRSRSGASLRHRRHRGHRSQSWSKAAWFQSSRAACAFRYERSRPSLGPSGSGCGRSPKARTNLRSRPDRPLTAQRVDEAAELAGDIWISIVVRDSQLVSVRADTRLEAEDIVVVLADANLPSGVAALFTTPARANPDESP